MPNEISFVEKKLELPTGNITLREGGSGDTILALHHSWGSVGITDWHENLAQSANVVVPDLPGWGSSERPSWARDARDIAILCCHIADSLRGKLHLVGTGFGGYVAAEMATMGHSRFNTLTLIGSAGVFPREGEIHDQMMVSHRKYVQDSYRSEELYTSQFGEEPDPAIREIWDHSREMTARVTWKPYMFNRRLEPLLTLVNTPTLLIWGTKDKIVPVGVANQFADLLPNSKLEMIDGAGHLVEMEEPDQVSALIKQHIKTN